MKRAVLVTILLVITMAVSFALPKPKYSGLNVLTGLDLPKQFPGWKSIDVSDQLNLQDDRYNFISNVFARMYEDRRRKQLLLLVLDAGNFHNPKVCYTSSGFSITELDDIQVHTQGGTFKATALLMKKDNIHTLLVYWLCIDKKVVSWTGQKMAELWSSLFNRKKAGFMVRLEIPVGNKNTPDALAFGGTFIQNFYESLDPQQKEYLFGK